MRRTGAFFNVSLSDLFMRLFDACFDLSQKSPLRSGNEADQHSFQGNELNTKQDINTHLLIIVFILTYTSSVVYSLFLSSWS